jgi:predicted enzyme related to lactoylglutathione lyase
LTARRGRRKVGAIDRGADVWEADMPHGDITHIDIPVTDNERAKAFYEAVFGWQIAEVPGYEGYPMWQAPNKISGGGLAPRSDGFTQPRSYVEVDSIDDALARATEKGGKVVMERQPISETSWWAVFEDPDGNHIGLYEGTTQT